VTDAPDAPDVDAPDVDAPDAPDVDAPDAPDAPDVDAPDVDAPDVTALTPFLVFFFFFDDDFGGVTVCNARFLNALPQMRMELRTPLRFGGILIVSLVFY
jgi:hypothetical protein